MCDTKKRENVQRQKKKDKVNLKSKNSDNIQMTSKNMTVTAKKQHRTHSLA